MKAIKRTVAALLATLMLATSTSFTLAAETYTDDEAVVVAKVNAAGIMTGTDKGFEPSKSLTRAEAAAIIVRMKGISESAVKTSAGTTLFKDVAASHWASGYVNQASNLGIVKGVSATEFAPDREVTVAEFTTMAVRALGAGQLVDSEGVWPTNYVNFANENDILKDVNAIYTATASRLQAATIVANTLVADMWEKSAVKSNGEITWTNENGKSILVNILKLTEDTMVVKEVSNNDHTVTNTSNKDFDVNENFDLSAIKTGLKYTYWYDEDKEVQGMWLKDSDSVEFTEITKVTASKVTLMVDGKEKEYKYDTTGEKALAYTVNEVSGVTLTKNENAFGTAYVEDGKVLSIYATDYAKYAVVDEVKSTKVTMKSGVEGDDDTAIITNNENNEYFITKNGKGITFSDLNEGDAIAYYTKTIKNGKKYVIEVITDSIEGKVTATGTGYVKVDKVKYDVAVAGLQADDEIEAWLNHAGDIVMYKKVKEAASTTAVVLHKKDRTSAYKDGSLDYSIEANLYFTDGTLSDKLTFDLEETYKEIEDLVSIVSATKIKFGADTDITIDAPNLTSTDKDELKSADKKTIAREYIKAKVSAGSVICYELSGSKLVVKPVDATEPEYVDAAGTLSIGKNSAFLTVAAFDFGSHTGITKVYVDEDTTFIKLKADGSDVKAETVDFEDLDDTSILGAGSFFMGYDEDNKTCSYVVFSATGSTVKRSKATNFAFVEEISTSKEDGETISEVDVIFTDGKRATYIADDDTDYTHCTSLEVGKAYDLSLSSDRILEADLLDDGDSTPEEDELTIYTTPCTVSEWLSSRRDLVTYENGTIVVAKDVLVLELDEDGDYSIKDMDDLRDWDDDATDNTVITKVITYIEDATDGEEAVIIVYSVIDRKPSAPIKANVTITAGGAGETSIKALVDGLEYSYNGGAYAPLTKGTAVQVATAVDKVIKVRVKATAFTLASDDYEVTVTSALIGE